MSDDKTTNPSYLQTLSVIKSSEYAGNIFITRVTILEERDGYDTLHLHSSLPVYPHNKNEFVVLAMRVPSGCGRLYCNQYLSHVSIEIVGG